MKKIGAVITAILMVFTMPLCVVGCSPTEQEPPEEKEPPEIPGVFYTVREAYNKGFLTQDDVKDCCYYRFGAVYNGADLWGELDPNTSYTPVASIGKLAAKVERLIKETYYKLYMCSFYDHEVRLGGIKNLSVQFFGEYDGSYAVTLDCDLWDFDKIGWGGSWNGSGSWWSSYQALAVFRTEQELPEETESVSEEVEDTLTGAFYTVREAYERGYLAKTDVQDCCWFRFQKKCDPDDLWGDLNWYEIYTDQDYKPSKERGELSEDIEQKIKQTYYDLFLRAFYDKSERLGGVEKLYVEFYGEYNGAYAVTVKSGLWATGAVGWGSGNWPWPYAHHYALSWDNSLWALAVFKLR